MYAIIETGGKQYTVKVGDVLRVELIDANPEEVVTLNTLAVGGEGSFELSPAAVVSARVMGIIREKKIHVFKYKAKKNVRKRIGHRQWHTVLEITAIG